MTKRLFAAAVALLLPLAAAAQTRVQVEDAECLPIEDNGLLFAQVSGEPGGSTVRLYFRRLHEEVEDFYYVEMTPAGNGRYWAVPPKAADEKLDVKKLQRDLAAERQDEEAVLDELGDEADDYPQAAWWVVKERTDLRDPNDDLNTEIIDERAQTGKQMRRDWMLAMTLPQLQDWLEQLENEPTEYFASVYDASGREIARSPMKVVEVTEDCDVRLDAVQRGQANNLVVGETAPWEIGRNVFHWLCDGVVTRRDYQGILRADEICRACLVAWLDEAVVAASSGLIGITGIVIDREPPFPPDDRPVSEQEPGDATVSPGS